MSASFDAKMTEGMSAFRMFEQLTVNRSHNKGTLSVEENRFGQVTGLRCVNHHFWNRLSNTSAVTLESANKLRSVFEQAVNEELKRIFDSAIMGMSEGTSACEGDELLAKIKGIKEAFHNAIFPTGCDKKLVKFERKDIRNIVMNVNELRNFGTARALLNASVSDLCRLATDNASSARVATVSDKSECGEILQAGNHALALIRTAPKGKLLEIGNDLLKTIDKDMRKYPTDFEVIKSKCDWVGGYNEFKSKVSEFSRCHASDLESVTMTKDELQTFKGLAERINKGCEELAGFCKRFVDGEEIVLTKDLPEQTVEAIKAKAGKMLACIGKVKAQYDDFLGGVEVSRLRAETIGRMANDVNLAKLADLSNESVGLVKDLLDKEIRLVNDAFKSQGVWILTCTEKGLVIREDAKKDGEAQNLSDLRNDVGILIRTMMDRTVDVFKNVEVDKQRNPINAKLRSSATYGEIQSTFKQICDELEDDRGAVKIVKQDMRQSMVNTLGQVRDEAGRDIRFGTYIPPSTPKVSNKKKNHEPTLLNAIELIGTETECRIPVGKNWKLNLRLFSDKIRREGGCEGKRFPEAFENFVDTWVKSFRPPDHYTDDRRMLVKAAVVKVLKFCAPVTSKNVEDFSNDILGRDFERKFFGADKDDDYVDRPAEEIMDEVVPLFEAMFGKGPVARLNETTLEEFLKSKRF